MVKTMRQMKINHLPPGIILATTWMIAFSIRLICIPACGIDPFPALFFVNRQQFTLGRMALFMLTQFLLFDYLMGAVGIWTLLVPLTYIAIEWSFSKSISTLPRTLSLGMYYTILCVLSCDIVGLTIGPFFFGQPILDAVLGQIPFTIDHIARSCLFTFMMIQIYKPSVFNITQYVAVLKNKTFLKKS
jgi:hypothetical protein